MKRDALIRLAIELIESYNLLKVTPVTHVEQWLTEHRDRVGQDALTGAHNSPKKDITGADVLAAANASPLAAILNPASPTATATAASPSAAAVGAEEAGANATGSQSGAAKVGSGAADGGEEKAFVRTFLREVFYGTERYAKLLKMTVNGIYDRFKTARRQDITLYTVLSYLTVFRIDELGFDEYRKIILSHDAYKMHIFLSFMFGDSQLNKWFPEQWSILYDHLYVESKLIGSLKQYIDSVAMILHELKPAMQAAQHEQAAIDSDYKLAVAHVAVDRKPLTTFAPFAFHSTTSKKKRSESAGGDGAAAGADDKSAPPPVPAFKAKPVPDWLFRVNLKTLERADAERRAKSKKQTHDKFREAKAPEFATDSRLNGGNGPSRQQRILEEAETKRTAEYAQFKPKPAPDFAAIHERETAQQEARQEQQRALAAAQAALGGGTISGNVAAPIARAHSGVGGVHKMTTAAILREDAAYRRQQEEKIKAIKNYESTLKDDSEFTKWQKTMQEKDEKQRAAVMEQRRQDQIQSALNAAKAVEQKQAANTAAAAEAKAESERLAKQRLAEAEALAEENRKKREAVNATRAAAGEAAAAVVEQKMAVVLEAKKAKEQRAIAVAAERKAELATRKDLIKKIQAMENVARVRARRPKEVDPTHTGSLGLLSEMSLVELHARVQLLKSSEEHFTAQKRAAIQASKTEKQARIEAIARSHANLRSASKADHTLKRNVKAEAIADATAVHTAALEEKEAVWDSKSQAKREAKRAEAIRLAADIKQRKQKAAFYDSHKKQIAAARAADLLAGAEREQKTRIKHSEKLAALEVAAKQSAAAARSRQLRAVQKEQTNFLRSYDNRLSEIKKEVSAFENAEFNRKQQQTAMIKARVAEVKHRMNERVAMAFGNRHSAEITGIGFDAGDGDADASDASEAGEGGEGGGSGSGADYSTAAGHTKPSH